LINLIAATNNSESVMVFIIIKNMQFKKKLIQFRNDTYAKKTAFVTGKNATTGMSLPHVIPKCPTSFSQNQYSSLVLSDQLHIHLAKIPVFLYNISV
jgi:hypothetical protein